MITILPQSTDQTNMDNFRRSHDGDYLSALPQSKMLLSRNKRKSTEI